VRRDSRTIGPRSMSILQAVTAMHGSPSKKCREATEQRDRARCLMRSWFAGVSRGVPCDRIVGM